MSFFTSWLRKKTEDRPIQPEARGEFVCGKFRAWPGPPGQFFVEREAGSPWICVDQHQVDLARSCEDSRPWEEHLRAYARAHRMAVSDLGDDLRDPGEMIRMGLVDPVGSAALGSVPEAPPPVAVMGFLTQNRPEALGRAVTSFRRHIDACGRSLPIVIADDSQEPSAREATAGMVGALGGGLHHLDASSQTAWARELQRATGVDAEILDWGLGRTGVSGVAPGGITNTLHLLGAGHLMVQSDDDFVFHPQALRMDPQALCLGGNFQAQQFRYGMDFFRPVPPIDYIGWHERLLGQALARLISGEGAFRKWTYRACTPEVRRRMARPDATVRCTLAGLYGDPGTLPFDLLRREEKSVAPGVWVHEEILAAALNRRFVHRVAPVATVALPNRGANGASGLDGRTLVPPMFPHFRGHDSLFAQTLSQCDEGAWIGHLPVSLAHLPPTLRSMQMSWPEDDATPALIFQPALVVVELQRMMVEAGAPSDGPGRLRHIGRGLTEIAADAAEFAGQMSLSLKGALVREIAWAEELLSSVQVPAARQHLQQWIQRLETEARRPVGTLTAAYESADLSSGGLSLRGRVARYGRWCGIWPDLWAAASAMALEEKLARFTRRVD
jgi:hypothetical protein